jgi:hypothetical protein
MDKHQSSLLIIFSFAASAVIVFMAFRPKTQVPSSITPSPAPVALAKASQTIFTVSVGSPDGKFSLIMKQKKESSTSLYSFWLKDETKGTQSEIFTKDETGEITLSIPENTFSPDNKYVFLKETGSGATNYLAIKDSQVLDIVSLFLAKHQNYVITDVTGWAAPTLLVINTNKSDGSLGPSFWFDVASKSFIQLVDRFN